MTRQTTLTLIGGPTVLIEIAGLRLLTDPTFDPPGHYTLPHVTLEKRTPPARDAASLGRIDAVLLSHDQHADNLDHAGRELLQRASITFTTRADSNDAIETARAFPQAQIVAAHTDGWAHFTESGDDLAHTFAALGLGDRLCVLSPGVPTGFALQD